MTAAELIAQLQALPPETSVTLRIGGMYQPFTVLHLTAGLDGGAPGDLHLAVLVTDLPGVNDALERPPATPASGIPLGPFRLVVRHDVALATAAAKHIAAARHPRTELQKRLFAFRVALWAKPARWFGAACIRLQHVGRTSTPDRLQLIALLVEVMCFKLCHLCFKRAIAVQHREILRMGGSQLADRIFKLAEQLDPAQTSHLSVAQANHRLGDIKRALEAIQSEANFTSRHEVSPVAEMTHHTLRADAMAQAPLSSHSTLSTAESAAKATERSAA